MNKKKLRVQAIVVVSTIASALFVLCASLMLTFILLSLLPTHDDPRHNAIIESILFKTDISFLTISEQEHMHDVRFLAYKILFTLFVSSIVIKIFGFSKYTLHALLTVFTFFLGALLRGFSAFWNLFHKIFFPQGNWQFAQESILITLYPEKYFFAATLVFFGILCIVSSASVYFRRRFSKKK